MKNLLIIVSLVASALLQMGCGVTDSINQGCRGSDLEGLCDFTFGYTDRQQDSQIKDLTAYVYALSNSITKEIAKGDERLQLQINSMQAELTRISTAQQTVSLIDPCGDLAGYYDEVLMRIEDGRLVAYFEDGGRRFLTVLQANVSYQTTDKQKCVFSVDENNQVVY